MSGVHLLLVTTGTDDLIQLLRHNEPITDKHTEALVLLY